MSGLEKEFPGAGIHARSVDATTAESVAAVQALGFQRHGIAIYGGDGSALFKQADHTVDVETVREKLRELTQGS